MSKTKSTHLLLAIASLSLVAGVSAGCSMCCGNYDYTYPTFGGVHQRVTPEYGRVGSIYSDPMANPGTEAPTNPDRPPEDRPGLFQNNQSVTPASSSSGFDAQPTNPVRGSTSSSR